MNCEDSKQLISEYIDGGKNTELEAHLAECDICRRYYEDLNKTVKLCNSVSPTPLPDDFKERLNKKLNNIDIIPWYKNKKMYAGIAGLAACLLIVTGPIYSIYEKSSQPFENDTSTAEIVKFASIPDTSAEPQISNDVQAEPTPLEADMQTTEAYKPAKTEQTSNKPISTSKAYAEPQNAAEPYSDATQTLDVEESATDITPFVSDIPVTDFDESIAEVSAQETEIPEPVSEEAPSLPETASYTEPVEPVMTAKISSGGGSSARNMPEISEEIKTLVTCYSSSAKLWFDENITLFEISESDGITVYKITEEDSNRLNEVFEITGYTEASLPEGTYITFN